MGLIRKSKGDRIGGRTGGRIAGFGLITGPIDKSNGERIGGKTYERIALFRPKAGLKLTFGYPDIITR